MSDSPAAGYDDQWADDEDEFNMQDLFDSIGQSRCLVTSDSGLWRIYVLADSRSAGERIAKKRKFAFVVAVQHGALDFTCCSLCLPVNSHHKQNKPNALIVFVVSYIPC